MHLIIVILLINNTDMSGFILWVTKYLYVKVTKRMSNFGCLLVSQSIKITLFWNFKCKTMHIERKFSEYHNILCPISSGFL